MVETYTGNLGHVQYKTASGEIKTRSFWGEEGLNAERKYITSRGGTILDVTYTSTSGREVHPEGYTPPKEEPKVVHVPKGASSHTDASGETTIYYPNVLPGSPIKTYAKVERKNVFNPFVNPLTTPVVTTQEILSGGKPAHTLTRTQFIGWAGEQRQLAEQHGDTEASKRLIDYQVEATQNWHPDTTVTFNKEGFTANFPVEGGENWKAYERTFEKNKTHIVFASGFTKENPLWLGSLGDIASGSESNERYIKTMIYGKQLKSEGLVGFGKYALYESPISIFDVAIGYGVGKAGGFVVKGVSKGAVSVGSKIVSKYSTKIPSSSSILKNVLKSDTMVNFEKWAVKGYKPGRELAEVSIGPPVRATGGGGTEFFMQKVKYVPNKQVGFWERRIWMSPEEIAKYNTRIASSGTINIGFPESRAVAGVGEIRGVTTSEVFKRGTLRGLKPRVYMSATAEKQIGKQAGTLLGYDLEGLGSFTRGKGIVQPGVDLSPGRGIKWGGYDNISDMLKGGYPSKFWNLEGGKQIIDFSPGFKSGTRILSEKPIWNLNKSLKAGLFRFGKSETGYQTITPKIDTTSVNIIRKMGGTKKSIYSPVTVKTPATGTTVSSSSLLATNISKHYFEPEVKNLYGQTQLRMLLEGNKQTYAPLTHNLLGNKELQSSFSLTSQASLLKQQQKQSTVQVLERTFAKKTAAKSITIKNMSSVHSGLFPSLGLSRLRGRGTGGWDESSLAYKYHFRKSKIGLPFDTNIGSKILKKLKKVKL